MSSAVILEISLHTNSLGKVLRHLSASSGLMPEVVGAAYLHKMLDNIELTEIGEDPEGVAVLC
jgi:hypothetical protein